MEKLKINKLIIVFFMSVAALLVFSVPVNAEDIEFRNVRINGQLLPLVPEYTDASQLRTD